uniref:PAP2_C domain-containing protein n=1 Tax=Strongyloides venezuelensis TaxID=75913 RepID=A0A0K0FQE3_STRVS
MANTLPEAEEITQSLVSTASSSASFQIEKDNNSTSSFIRDSNKLPAERYKFLIAFLLCSLSAFGNTVILSYVHDFRPTSKPLPDISFSITPYMPVLLYYNEYILLLLLLASLFICILHKHRWILLRRLFIITTMLFFGRMFTLLLTTLPNADPNYPCAPRFTDSNRTIIGVLRRAAGVYFGGGLQVDDSQNMCGDYIYSGHTAVVVISTLFINEYSPRRWKYVHFVTWPITFIALLFLLISRGHYTIDVAISYWLTTRIFWEYHTFAANPYLRDDVSRDNHLRKYGWLFICRVMENNVHTGIPDEFDNPIKYVKSLFRGRTPELSFPTQSTMV